MARRSAPETPYERRQRIQRAQAAYVERWRAEHAVDTWGAFWLCPLCNKAVQAFFGPGAHKAQIEHHQLGHGDDWHAYEAAAPAAE